MGTRCKGKLKSRRCFKLTPKDENGKQEKVMYFKVYRGRNDDKYKKTS